MYYSNYTEICWCLSLCHSLCG